MERNAHLYCPYKMLDNCEANAVSPGAKLMPMRLRPRPTKTRTTGVKQHKPAMNAEIPPILRRSFLSSFFNAILRNSLFSFINTLFKYFQVKR